MSSFNVHKRKVLNSDLPLSHRYSNLRSIVNKVAGNLNCSRADIIQRLLHDIGINVEGGAGEDGRNEANLMVALDKLEEWRNRALGRF